jgi:hypothetical protein
VEPNNSFSGVRFNAAVEPSYYYRPHQNGAPSEKRQLHYEGAAENGDDEFYRSAAGINSKKRFANRSPPREPEADLSKPTYKSYAPYPPSARTADGRSLAKRRAVPETFDTPSRGDTTSVKFARATAAAPATPSNPLVTQQKIFRSLERMSTPIMDAPEFDDVSPPSVVTFKRRKAFEEPELPPNATPINIDRQQSRIKRKHAEVTPSSRLGYAEDDEEDFDDMEQDSAPPVKSISRMAPKPIEKKKIVPAVTIDSDDDDEVYDSSAAKKRKTTESSAPAKPFSFDAIKEKPAAPAPISATPVVAEKAELFTIGKTSTEPLKFDAAATAADAEKKAAPAVTAFGFSSSTQASLVPPPATVFGDFGKAKAEDDKKKPEESPKKTDEPAKDKPFAGFAGFGTAAATKTPEKKDDEAKKPVEEAKKTDNKPAVFAGFNLAPAAAEPKKVEDKPTGFTGFNFAGTSPAKADEPAKEKPSGFAGFGNISAAKSPEKDDAKPTLSFGTAPLFGSVAADKKDDAAPTAAKPAFAFTGFGAKPVTPEKKAEEPTPAAVEPPAKPAETPKPVGFVVGSTISADAVQKFAMTVDAGDTSKTFNIPTGASSAAGVKLTFPTDAETDAKDAPKISFGFTPAAAATPAKPAEEPKKVEEPKKATPEKPFAGFTGFGNIAAAPVTTTSAATEEKPKPASGFTFGATAPAAVPATQVASAAEKPAAPVFGGFAGFGTKPAAEPAKPAAEESAKPIAFGFNKPTEEVKPVAFGFGKPAEEAKPAATAPAPSPFGSFGIPAATPAATPAAAPAAAPVTGLFGAASAATQTPSPFGGFNPTPAAAPTNTFGAASGAAKLDFGASSNAPAGGGFRPEPATGGVGAAAPGVFMFGASNIANTTTSNPSNFDSGMDQEMVTDSTGSVAVRDRFAT